MEESNNDYLNRFGEKILKTKFCFEDGKTQNYSKGMERLYSFFIRCKEIGSKVIFIGNGGSAAIAMHMTADFMKNGGLRTVSMYDSATITCLGNDYGYEYIFSKQIGRIANSGDVLVAISSSGKSPNIVKAIQVARNVGVYVVTFTGFREDNIVNAMGNIGIYVPCEEYGIVESIHNLILQQIVDRISE